VDQWIVAEGVQEGKAGQLDNRLTRPEQSFFGFAEEVLPRLGSLVCQV
jgi:hypothetical protein